jgi:hypothetical protein
MNVMAVTGFVDNAFPAKHLANEQCRALGDRLKACIPGNIHAFDQNWKLQSCWAHSLMLEHSELQPSCANPPADRFLCPQDMVKSNIVLLQRYEWMQIAMEIYPQVDIFAWIEYTVLKQKGVTEKVIQDFIGGLKASRYDAISLPGCWHRSAINDSEAHWRFCGSCWVCPRKYVDKVFTAVNIVASLRTRMTGKLSWDMNTMAYVELLDILPIRWYPANHDQTQFTNY